MVKHRQIARRIKNELRAKDCSEIAVEAINRNLTISINGTLKQKTIIQSLVGMSATKLSVHSINKAVEKVPCETSVRYHLSKVDLDSLWDMVPPEIANVCNKTVPPPCNLGQEYQSQRLQRSPKRNREEQS